MGSYGNLFEHVNNGTEIFTGIGENNQTPKNYKYGLAVINLIQCLSDANQKRITFTRQHHFY